VIKKNKTVFVALVAAVGAIVWYVALFAPLKAERGRLDTTVSAAHAKQQELRALRVSLRELAGKQGAQQSELERLRRLVPPQPDVAGFILGANDAAVRAGVDWLSVSPAAAVAGAGGAPSSIGVSIAVNGSFFTVVSYLRHLEGMARLVVVDSLQLTPGGGLAGPLRLSATVSARIFTTAVAPLAPGATAAPAAEPATGEKK
jgi:Tfp pilus assembly protein PilO